MLGKTEKSTDMPEIKQEAADSQPAGRGFFSRMGQKIKSGASTCWRGVKYLASVLHNPAVIALSAVGAAGMLYGGGSVITSTVGPSLWLLAAPVTGLVATFIVKFRPRKVEAAEKFQTAETIFDHATRVISRTGFHYLYFSRIAKQITGGPLTPMVGIIIPATAFTTALLGHLLNESLKNKENPNCLLALLNAMLVSPIDYGSALSPTFYVFGPDNAGLLDPNVILYTEIGLTAVGFINEVVVNPVSKKAKIVVEGAFNCMQAVSRAGYLLSTIESLIALNNNDDVPMDQLLITSGFLATVVVPFDISVSLRKRSNEYKKLTQGENQYQLLGEDASIQQKLEPVIDHSTATWQLPECECCSSKKVAPQAFFQPQSESDHDEETPVVVEESSVNDKAQAVVIEDNTGSTVDSSAIIKHV
jgi:hypothetical protein